MFLSSPTSLLLLAALALNTITPCLATPAAPRPPGRIKTPKYFNEPGGSLSLGHYDKRFFKAEVPYEEHRVVLRDLIRSYLNTLREHGAETWLAHGTLLGWWWNGSTMPWDYDLDVQVSNGTMQWLADHLNRTEHVHSWEDHNPDGTSQKVQKRYLLDINPHHVDLDRGDGMNIIDGRWIDMDNGMFIDITGVREREADRPGVWSCKNKHRYGSLDLWPMRTTEFEGVPARIPYNFEKILTDEYGVKSLVVEEFQGHHWDHNIREWVRMSDEDQEKSKAAATERKKQELSRQGRL